MAQYILKAFILHNLIDILNFAIQELFLHNSSSSSLYYFLFYLLFTRSLNKWNQYDIMYFVISYNKKQCLSSCFMADKDEKHDLALSNCCFE